MKRILAMAVGAVVLLPACAGVGRPGARPGPDVPTGTRVAPSPYPGSTLEPRPEVVEPREGLVDVRAHAWETVDVEDPDTLLVAFYGGVPECFGVDRVEVDYGEEDITVTLYTGRLPHAEVCIEVALYLGVRVDLDEPVAGRKIRDGAPDD